MRGCMQVSVLVGLPSQGWLELWPPFTVTTSFTWRRQAAHVNRLLNLLRQHKTCGAPCFIKTSKVFQSLPLRIVFCGGCSQTNAFMLYTFPNTQPQSMATLLAQWTWTKLSDLLPAVTSVVINASALHCAGPYRAGFAFSSVCCPFKRSRAVQLDRSVDSGLAPETRRLGKIMMNEGLTGEKWLLWNPYWSASWSLFHVEPQLTFQIGPDSWIAHAILDLAVISEGIWDIS